MKRCCYCRSLIWSMKYYSDTLLHDGNKQKYYYHTECYLNTHHITYVPPSESTNDPVIQMVKDPTDPIVIQF